jgi:hypothetical protein
MNMTAFWDIARCNLFEIHDVSEVCTTPVRAMIMEAVRTSETSVYSTHCPLIIALWKQYAPLKRQSTSMRLYCGISQKAVIFIFAAVRT